MNRKPPHLLHRMSSCRNHMCDIVRDKGAWSLPDSDIQESESQAVKVAVPRLQR